MAYLWLQQLLNLLLPELESLPAGPEGEAQARAWFERLLARFVERGLSTPAQQKNRVVDARNAIRARFGDDHPSLAFVGFDENTWQQINLPTHDRTEARNEHQRLLRHPEKIVARAAKLLESARFEDLAVGLGLTTGRRMSELLDGHARLEPATAWSVLFTGQRKHKGDREEFSFEIPTLAPAEKVLGAWERLQVMLGDEVLDPQSINNRYGHAVNQAADRHFRGLIPPRLPAARKGKEGGVEDPHASERGKDALYLHLFRAVYATIAVHWFCPPRVNRLVFKAEIQGHRRVLDAPTRAMRRSYTAARHYDDYQVADASGKNLDGRQGIKLGKLPGVEVLQAFQSPPEGQAETPEAASIPAPPAPPAEATTDPVPPSLPPPTLAAMDPDPVPATQEPPPPDSPASTPAAGTTPAQEAAGGEAPKVKKPRPITYRIYPADKPRLDAFRTEPTQTQADNLQAVLDLLENASAAIREQDQTQAQLQEARAWAEQIAQERDQAAAEGAQARQEAQAAAGRLQAQEEELRRLQEALEQAQAQAAAAVPAPAAGGGGTPVALAVLARELLDLATGGECQGEVQGRLIALAGEALGAGGAGGHQGKRQDAKTPVRAGTPAGQVGQRKVVKAAVDPARFGELFAQATGGAVSQPRPNAGSQEGQESRATPRGAQPPAQAGSIPVAAGGDPKGTGEQPGQDNQDAAEAAQEDGNKGPVVPRLFTRRGGAAEKLEKALQAVWAHNEAQTSRERKWAVTESALARLTGCFRPAVRAFFAARAAEIEEHNHKHHLAGGHNAARGKRGETIEGEVEWRGENGAGAGTEEGAGAGADTPLLHADTADQQQHQTADGEMTTENAATEAEAG